MDKKQPSSQARSLREVTFCIYLFLLPAKSSGGGFQSLADSPICPPELRFVRVVCAAAAHVAPFFTLIAKDFTKFCSQIVHRSSQDLSSLHNYLFHHLASEIFHPQLKEST
jgi:hypothetical protein